MSGRSVCGRMWGGEYKRASEEASVEGESECGIE